MNNRDFIRGIGIGLIASGVVGVALTSGKRKRKKFKNHTIRAMGEVVDNVTDRLGF